MHFGVDEKALIIAVPSLLLDAHKIDRRTGRKSLDRHLCLRKLVKMLMLLKPLELKKPWLHMASDKMSLKYKNEVF